MSALEAIVARARGNPKRIVLSEGTDPRVVAGAVKAAIAGIARPILLGEQPAVEAALAEAGASSEACRIVDPATDPKRDEYIEAYRMMRAGKGATSELARDALGDPMVFAAMMVRQGGADGTVGGATTTTTHTVRVALQVIGPAPGITTVSSFFLMALEGGHHTRKGVYVFSDCGLVIEPTSAQLADIAISSAASFQSLTSIAPSVALLSFSTRGSASHDRVDRVTEALALVHQRHPELVADGELQFDAAFVPDVARSKVPGSVVGGNANVLIFPNLEAGNIGYKIAQRIGGAIAIGPILQGLAKPANDLSRGCSSDDVFHAIAVTVVQAGEPS